jgi:hypothetical protein
LPLGSTKLSQIHFGQDTKGTSWGLAPGVQRLKLRGDVPFCIL